MNFQAKNDPTFDWESNIEMFNEILQELLEEEAIHALGMDNELDFDQNYIPDDNSISCPCPSCSQPLSVSTKI